MTEERYEDVPDDGLSTVRPGRDEAIEPSPEPFFSEERYRLGTAIGSGGGGQVFEARDRILDRTVALKFLQRPDPVSAARLMREARAQAGVDHPHICKVYEVGEAAGRVFIAMQRIRGEPFGKLATRMTAEQKAIVLRQVASAVHAAHRRGLIHRDLKPANIMIETGEDGQHHAYVLDFGLASHSLAPDDPSAGTPGYMAPEQISERALDRRTDVFGLGATLYAVSSGRPPFRGNSRDAVFSATQRGALEKPVAGVPADLGHIALKCLETDPEDRYPSARALEDDLNRYLDGEPVKARNGGWGYRLVRKVRKHPLLSAVLMVAVAALVWVALERTQKATQTRLAGRLATLVEDIETSTRLSHMAPTHDIEPDRAALAAKMDEIVSIGRLAGGWGRGPTDHALGWGYLHLDQPERAIAYLNRARDSGYADPNTALALGIAHLELYRSRLPALHTLADPRERAEERDRLVAELRDPALAWLEASGEAFDRGFLLALKAYAMGAFEDALNLIPEETKPWQYDHLLWQADIGRDAATSAGEAGNLDRAREWFRRSEQASREALAVAPSDPEIVRGLLATTASRLRVTRYTPEDRRAYLETGLAEVARLRQITPNSGEASFWEAHLLLLEASADRAEGKPAADSLARASAAIDHALTSGWSLSLSFLESAAIKWQMALDLAEKKQDPRELIEEVVAALEEVADRHRGDTFFNILARAHKTHAQWQIRLGEAPEEAYRLAVEAYRGALARRPQSLKHHSGLANALMGYAASPDCPEPGRILEEAIATLEQARVINPNHPVLHFQLGQAWYRSARGADPLGWRLDEAAAREADRHYSRALALNPGLIQIYNAQGWLRCSRARRAQELGLDAEPHFQAAISSYEAGLERAPAARLLHQNLAWVWYFRGKQAIRQGRDPGMNLERARKHIQKALDGGRALEALLCEGSIDRLAAERAFDQGENPGPLLASAVAWFEEILTINPSFAEAYRSLGRAATLEARATIRAGSDPEAAFRRAEQALERALELKEDHPEFHLALARLVFHRERWRAARGEAPRAERGIAAILRARELQPDNAETQIIETALRSLEGDPAAPAIGRSLLSRYPHLTHAWGTVFDP